MTGTRGLVPVNHSLRQQQETYSIFKRIKKVVRRGNVFIFISFVRQLHAGLYPNTNDELLECYALLQIVVIDGTYGMKKRHRFVLLLVK